MVNRKITIGHLYPKQMNVYGDMGNIIALRYRLEQRGVRVEYVALDTLRDLKKHPVDILIGGGGQDSNQGLIQQDLLKYAADLKAQCDDGLVCLMVCGMYQLFGSRFITQDGVELLGAGVLDIETRAGDNRLIGNVVIDSTWGKLVGFENHSGKTYRGTGVSALGVVQKGAGNNGEDKSEGAVVNNVFGTYMHGPLLAKNSGLTDELIVRAFTQQGEGAQIEPLDDQLEQLAASIAIKRPR